MTETEKTIRSLEALRAYDTDYAYDLKVAIKALRACEAIRELIEREGREASAAEIEGLLP